MEMDTRVGSWRAVVKTIDWKDTAWVQSLAVTYWLCALGQLILPLCTSISLYIKRGVIIISTSWELRLWRGWTKFTRTCTRGSVHGNALAVVAKEPQLENDGAEGNKSCTMGPHHRVLQMSTRLPCRRWVKTQNDEVGCRELWLDGCSCNSRLEWKGGGRKYGPSWAVKEE